MQVVRLDASVVSLIFKIFEPVDNFEIGHFVS